MNNEYYGGVKHFLSPSHYAKTMVEVNKRIKKGDFEVLHAFTPDEMVMVSMKNMQSLYGGHAIIVFYNDTCFLMASASEIAQDNIVYIFLERNSKELGITAEIPKSDITELEKLKKIIKEIA